MKYTKIFACIAALVILGMQTGCDKDNNMNSIRIAFDNFDGGEKAYVNGLYTFWETGDGIRLSRYDDEGHFINSYDGIVSISIPSGAAEASVSAGTFDTDNGDSVYAAYPGDTFRYTQLAHEFDCSLSNEYTYITTNGKQKVMSPMVGRVKIPEGRDTTLKLRNLCCMLRIKIDKDPHNAYTLDRIVVINETKGSPMSGNATVVFDGNFPQLNMTGSASTNDKVTLNMTTNKVGIQGTHYFYVPIPPIASGQTLKIMIHNALTGKWKWNTIVTNSAIPGNAVATIQGPSTYEEGDSPYTFYDYIQNDNSNCYINLGVKPDNTSKMEMTFKIVQVTPSQYYSGSNNPTQHKTVFSIGGSSTAGTYGYTLSSYFCGENVTSEGSNAGQSILRNSTNLFRVTTEVMAGSGNNYYMRTKFEMLDASGNVLKALTKDSDPVQYGIDVENNPLYAGWSEIPDLWVFGYNTERLNPGMKLYSYRVWKGGVLTHNFVPAERNSDHAKGVLNMAVNPMVFIPGNGNTGFSYTLGDD